MASGNDKKRYMRTLYDSLRQVSDEEGVDFGIDALSYDQFRERYGTRTGLSKLYDSLSAIGDEVGLDFGIGTKDEWLGSFTYHPIANSQQPVQKQTVTPAPPASPASPAAGNVASDQTRAQVAQPVQQPAQPQGQPMSGYKTSDAVGANLDLSVVEQQAREAYRQQHPGWSPNAKAEEDAFAQEAVRQASEHRAGVQPVQPMGDDEARAIANGETQQGGVDDDAVRRATARQVQDMVQGREPSAAVKQVLDKRAAAEEAARKAAEEMQRRYLLPDINRQLKEIEEYRPSLAGGRKVVRGLARGTGNLVGGDYTLHGQMMRAAGDAVLDKDARIWAAAGDYLDDAKQLIGEAESGRGTAGSVASGVADAATDMRTWDFGVGEVTNNAELREALEKYDNGDELSEGEQALLDAFATKTMAEGLYKTNMWYNAGKMTTEMLPFMAEMIANPLAGTGKAAQRGLSKYLLSRFGSKGLAKWGGRAARVAVDTTAGGMGMTATSGAGRVVADAGERMRGEVTGQMDKQNHRVAIASHEEGEDALTAYRKALVSQGIENASEMWGAYLAPVAGKVLPSAIRKGLDKAVTAIGKSPTMGTVRQLLERGQWHGVFGEYMEELMGNVANALVVGDMTLDDAEGTGVFNKDLNIETFLGVAVGTFALGGVATGGYAYDRVRVARNKARSRQQADALLGDDKAWMRLRDMKMGDEGFNDALQAVLYDGERSDEAKTAVLNWATAEAARTGLTLGEEWEQQERDGKIEYGRAEGEEVQSEADKRMAESDKLIEKRMHMDGAIYPATLKDDSKVYIVAGQVKTLDDGSIDVSGSREANGDDMVYVVDEAGKPKAVSISDFLSVDQPIDPLEEMTRARDAIKAEVGEQAETEAATPVTYGYNDMVTLQTEEGAVRGSITSEANEDGLIEVWTESPIDGKKVNQFTKEQLDAMVVDHKKAEAPVEEAPVEDGSEVAATETPAAETEETVVEQPEQVEDVQAEEPAGNVQADADAMPMIAVGEDEEPDFKSTTPARAHTYIYNEAGLSREDADAFVENNRKAAEKALKKVSDKKPQMGTSIAKFKREQAEYDANVQAAQREVDYWNEVKDNQRQAVEAMNAERRAAQAEATAQAIEEEQARQAEVERKREEQAALGANNVAPAIREKWEAAPKVEGARNEIVLADGERVPGRYMLVESGAATPSHNPNAEFVRNEGFPIDDNGQTVNDRDYERDRVTARDEYERMVASGLYQFREAVQDSMIGLERLYKAILGKDYEHIENVDGYENAYLAENRMSSVNAAEQHDYYINFMRPLLEAIGAIAGSKKSARQALMDYMMAKHGLERNRVFAERDAREVEANGGDFNDAYQKFREKDYSGLTALTGEDDVVAAEAAAQQIVDDYEAAYDTADLWDRTREATQATLEKIYRSGLLSKEQYEKIRDMFQYYIPLQGWDETTSDEVYGYLTSRSGIGGSPIKHAVGRSSKADDPIATIAMMADAAIRQGNRNQMKQHFLNFVMNHPSDLVSVNDLWLQYDETSDEWKPVFADLEDGDTAADVERKVEAFEQRMEQLAEAEPDRYKRGSDAKNIPYKVVKGNLKEHQVLVKRGGQTFVLTINGNPRAAQALNGLTNPDVETSGVVGNMLKLGEYVNHKLSAFYTTRNPDFVVSNFFRDMLYSNCMTWVKENPRYALRFHKNFGKMNPATMRRLLGKWEAGTLNQRNYTERMFYQFMMNGGETGYTSVLDIEEHKKKITEELKKQSSTTRKALAVLGLQLDMLNRSVENCARFAAFVTSREMGRSIDRSIYDAKEVSVNFNKKGSGGKMVNATGQTLLGKIGSYVSGGGRLAYVFWNAGVQGMTNFGRAGKRHGGKAFVGASAMFILGYVIPQLAAALGGGDGDDDDKNAYYNLPEYVRRSNICFRNGEQWITIPLPIEFRGIYGLGELASGVISGNEYYDDKELSYQTASQLSQILPLDMLEGGGGVSPWIPSSVKPYIEAYVMNKSWSGLPIYKDTPWNKNEPEWTKAYKNADQALVAASKWLNEATGGDDYKKGAIDINPAKIEYLLNGVFGGYMNTAEKLKKMGETALGEREFDWRNMLIANRIVKSGDERTANRKLQNEYFKYKDEYEETKRLLKKYENAADEGILGMAEKVNFLYNSPEYLRYEVFDEYRRDIDDYREDIKDAANDAERKELEAEMYATMRELIDQLHEIK